MSIDRAAANRTWRRALTVRRALLLAIGATLAAVAFGAVGADAANPLPNGGFEAGAEFWAIADEGSSVLPEAARTGNLGLRAGSPEYTASGAQVTSASLPVTAGQALTLRFWARATAGIGGVYLTFSGADGRTIADPALSASGGKPIRPVDQTDGEWHEYSLEATAPAGAASVSLWIHTWGGTAGTMDVDEVTLEGLTAGVTATPPPSPRPARLPVRPADAPPRAAPASVILKLDDFRLVGGKVHPTWRRLAELFEERGIRGSFGVLAGSLADATPEAVEWMRNLRAEGRVEFWLHGWDHGTHVVDGVACGEFTDRPYEEQKKRIDDSQRTAREVLGWAFTTFGPPGGGSHGSFDAETLRCLAEDPELAVMLYPQPLDDAGRQLEAGGKVTILDRVWAGNLEASVGIPHLKPLQAAWEAYPQRGIFVLQGHPLMWQGARWEEFLRILDFLQAQHAVFVTPTDYVAGRVRQ